VKEHYGIGIVPRLAHLKKDADKKEFKMICKAIKRGRRTARRKAKQDLQQHKG
jgi:hypothetical protein